MGRSDPPDVDAMIRYPDPIRDPGPRAWACLGCKHGTRVVEVMTIRGPSEGAEWKETVRGPQEWYLCGHPAMQEKGKPRPAVCWRIVCGLRKGVD